MFRKGLTRVTFEPHLNAMKEALKRSAGGREVQAEGCRWASPPREPSSSSRRGWASPAWRSQGNTRARAEPSRPLRPRLQAAQYCSHHILSVEASHLASLLLRGRAISFTSAWKGQESRGAKRARAREGDTVAIFANNTKKSPEAGLELAPQGNSSPPRYPFLTPVLTSPPPRWPGRCDLHGRPADADHAYRSAHPDGLQ